MNDLQALATRATAEDVHWIFEQRNRAHAAMLKARKPETRQQYAEAYGRLARIAYTVRVAHINSKD